MDSTESFGAPRSLSKVRTKPSSAVFAPRTWVSLVIEFTWLFNSHVRVFILEFLHFLLLHLLNLLFGCLLLPLLILLAFLCLSDWLLLNNNIIVVIFLRVNIINGEVLDVHVVFVFITNEVFLWELRDLFLVHTFVVVTDWTFNTLNGISWFLALFAVVQRTSKSWLVLVFEKFTFIYTFSVVEMVTVLTFVNWIHSLFFF